MFYVHAKCIFLIFKFSKVMQQHTSGVVSNLMWVLLEIYCSLQHWKNFANRSTIDKVIAMVRVAPFFDSQCRMWANAQRDGRPAEYRWRPLFNAAVWLTPTTRVPCSNAAKTRNPLKLPGVPQTNERISAASGLKFTIL